jgi:hypothetical protein
VVRQLKWPLGVKCLMKINSNNRQCFNTIKAATHHRSDQEIKFVYIRNKLNELLYKIHSENASTWQNNWQIIHYSSDDKLKRQWKHNKKNEPFPTSKKQRIPNLRSKQKYKRITILPQSTKFSRKTPRNGLQQSEMCVFLLITNQTH